MVAINNTPPERNELDDIAEALTSVATELARAFDPDQLDQFAQQLRILADSAAGAAAAIREFKSL